MPDQPQQSPGQVPDTAGQVPTPPTGQEPATSEQPSDSEARVFSAEFVAQLRRENADYRTRLKATETRLAEIDAATLTETQKLQKRLQELEAQYSSAQTQLRTQQVRYAVMTAAAQMGIVDPDAAVLLLNADTLEYDDGTGAPKAGSVKAALERLVAQRKYLLGGPTAPALSPTNPPAGGAAVGQTFTTAQIGDRVFWEAHRKEILQAMAEGRIVEA